MIFVGHTSTRPLNMYANVELATEADFSSRSDVRSSRISVLGFFTGVGVSFFSEFSGFFKRTGVSGFFKRTGVSGCFKGD